MENSTIDKRIYLPKLKEIFEPELAEEIIKFPIMEVPAEMTMSTDCAKVDVVPLVVKGSIRTVRMDERQKEIFIYDINPLECCIASVTSAMCGTEIYNFSGITNEDTAIFLISKEVTNEWLSKYESWRLFIFKLYENRIFDLLEKNDTVNRQKDEITKQKKDITDSIVYAQRIQNAALPPEDFIQSILPEHFILFKPRSIVSGDYYWISQIEDKTVIAVADCTGHGVPGAFMSMLGISLLNQMVSNSKLKHANEILDEMRENVKKSLRQMDKNSETRDGMDMVLMIFDFKNNTLEYSGAYNPIYILRNNELIELSADRMPIGIHLKEERKFTLQTFDFLKNDMFYAFSDGYFDQFGGQTSRKFMSRQFKELVLKINTESMSKQKELLIGALETWKGKHDQVDDILVMGIRA